MFSNNTSGTRGGAIATRDKTLGDNTKAKLDIVNATFTGNTAATDGGAFYNDFFNNVANEGYAIVSGSTFKKNSATNGGAVYNDDVDKLGHTVSLSIENGTFIGNMASAKGGAIYNAGIMTLKGTNVFEQNTAHGVSNDIYNSGTLEIVSGTTKMEGGISGSGSLTVREGATLNLGSSSIAQSSLALDGTIDAILADANNFSSFDIEEDNFTGSGTLNLTLKGVGEYNVFSGSVFDHEHVNVLSSSLFTYDWNNTYDTITVETKTVEEIAENTGVDTETVKPVVNMVQSSSNELKDLANKILEKLDSVDPADKVEVAHAVKAVHPETEAVVQNVATSVQTTVGNLAASRMSMSGMGRNGGDIKSTGSGFWANGLYNKSKQNGMFKGYTRGFAIGMDGTFNKKLTLGTGYSYSNSNVGASHRGTDIDSYTMFVYGQYKPSVWYANAVLNYTHSKYTETGSALGTEITSNYSVNAYGARLVAGYDMKNGWTPEAGLRYTHVNGTDYKNSLGVKNSFEDSDYMTLTLGGKYARNFKTNRKYITLNPEIHGLIKYDVMSDNQVATITMPGVNSYSLSGERLARFGTELGFGLMMKYHNVDWSLDYDFEIREDYTSHTGRIKWRYNF